MPDLRSATTPGDASHRRHVGGLVSALEPVLGARRGLWLGWSGKVAGDGEPGTVGIDEESRPALAWVDFTERWHRCYYNGFCNGALWPLLHSFPQHVSFVDEEWECYGEVNSAFAAAATELVSRTTPIWLHDYHLLLGAQALRSLGHRGPLGLFLHVPFPSPDLFALLPWAGEVIEAMLDFDLVGFHTENDVENFRRTVSAFSSARVGAEAIEHRGRTTRPRAFPIGIIAHPFQEPSQPTITAEVASLVQAIAPSRLVLGVDRLDYTKASRSASRRSGDCSSSFPSGAVASPWCRSRCRRAPRCRSTSSSGVASRTPSAGSTASSAARRGFRSATSAVVTRTRNSRSSTAPRQWDK